MSKQPLEELIAQAELGDEARKFLESDLCKVLIGFARQEVQAAQEALEEVSPTDIKSISDLQVKARVGRLFESWLNSLVDEGDNAIAIFRDQTRSE